MKNNNSQVINAVLIIGGGALLLYEISVEEEQVWFLIIGLVALMFGLYRATNFWVETKDDHKQENEEKSENNNTENRK